MSIELKLELGHRASLRTEPAADGFTHDWMIFVRGTKGSNISRIVDRVVFHLHDSQHDPNNPAEEPKPLRVSKSGYSCLLMPIDIYFRNKWKSSRVRLEYELVFPLGESPVYNICHEKLVFMNPPEEFHNCLMEAGGVIVPEETVEPLRIESYHYHELHPQGHPLHLPFQAKQIVCKRVCRETVESACKESIDSVCRDTVDSVCRDTLESVCRDTVESVCKDTVESICRDTVESVYSETGGAVCSSELSIHGKCNPTRLNKSCGIPYDLHSHPQQPHDVKDTSKGSSAPHDAKETSKKTANNDAVTVCGPKNIKVKLELGHRASIRDHPTREGFTHDWMVFVRGIEGCNISHFVEKVVFHLHESFPNRKRVVKKPPYQVTESGYGGFVMPIEVFFRNDEEPRKVRFEYDLFVRIKGPPILNIHREKLLFKNPADDFRRRLLKARGDWCMDHDKCFKTAPHVSRSLLRQFQEIEEAEKLAAVNSDYHKEDQKVCPKEFIMDSGPICQAENVVLSLDFTHESSMLEKPLPDGSTHSWTMEMRGFKDADISLFVDKVVFHLHESCPYPTRVVKDPPYQASEYGFASFTMAIDVYLKSEEEPKKLRFHHDVYLRVDPFPVNMVSQEKVVFQNPFPDLRDRLLKAGGVLVYSKCSVHHQQPKDQGPPPPSEDILQHSHGDLALPYHDPTMDELEAIQEALVRKKCPVHHEDENCDTTLCATLVQHIHELEEAERANGNSNGRPIETEPFMYLGSQRVDKKRNASIACFLMAKNAEQEDIQNKKLRIASHSTCSDLNPCGAYGSFEDDDSSECCALPGVAPSAGIVDMDCMLCAQMKRDVLFYPCGHIALCSMCSTSVKECIVCEEPVELGIKIGDCVVCSDKRASVIFEPCAHVCACDGCASRMKNCIQCQEQIEDTIPVTECCVPDCFDQPDLRTPSPSFSDASTIEEIVLDTHFPENSNTDIEKLQQELQDIKEQTMCPVCLDRLKNVIFMCGHGTCRICSKPITKCPICRKPVKKHIVLY